MPFVQRIFTLLSYAITRIAIVSVVILGIVKASHAQQPSLPEPKPECVSCPDGYVCNAAKTGCVKASPAPEPVKPKPKKPTEHPAVSR